MKNRIKLLMIPIALISLLHAQQDVTLAPIEVISATKTAQSLKDVTSDINVITSQEIEEKHYTTVAEALNSLSGISFTNNGGLGKTTSINLRGFDSNRVLVLIDGIRYNDITGLSGAPFSDLMISDIEQIEVVKGAQSGVWGADATAGVINIITKGSKKGLHASSSAEAGSFNTKKYGALVSYKDESYYVKIDSQKITTDGFSAQVPKGDDIKKYEKDGYTNMTFNFKSGLNLDESNKVDLSHTIIDSYCEYDGYKDPNGNLYSTTKNSFSQINFNHVDSFNKINIYAKKSLFERNYPQGYTKAYSGDVQEYGLKSNIPYADRSFIVIGTDYKIFEHKNELNEKYSNKGIFLTNNNKFDGFTGGKTILTESVRSDIYDTFDDKITGKLGVKHISEKIQGLVTSANIGTAYNVPTLYNLYDPMYGNSNLNPENTQSYDVTLGYDDFKITYFNSDVTDMIDYDFTTSKYNNIDGKSKLQGYELEYKTNITDAIAANANYTLLNAKNSNNKILARKPQKSIKAGLDYYASEALHFGLNGEYVGKRFEKDDEKGMQTGEYAVANFVANYDINKNFQTYLKVDNITDRYYQVVDGYATASRSGYIGMKALF
ncbi:MAG: TonB-dependent receptor [Campylobacterales bacterium]|nr:TonB-dependent receptor [Campylobacterales bacterium]